MQSKFRLAILALFAISLSCKDAAPKALSIDQKTTQISSNSKVEDSIFNARIQQIGNNFRSSVSKDTKEKWLQEGIELSGLDGKESFKDVFVKEILKLNPAHPDAADYLWYLADRLREMGSNEVASLIYKGFKNRFSSDPRSKDAGKYILSEQKDIHTYIKGRFKKLKSIQTEDIIKEQENFTKLIEAFALAFPFDTACPGYLISMAEVCGKTGNVSGMVANFDWVYQYYPESKEAPMALFLKGFYFENHFDKKAEAADVYQLFLKKYPAHNLTKDVSHLIKDLKNSSEN
ncbi:MAG: hypothetical protein IPK35_12465 [Saprospiraceae bacterium]|nr:hypothetical protein [Saprospiraceae bacterium]